MMEQAFMAAVMVGALVLLVYAGYVAGRRDERAWWVEKCAERINKEV
jgi:hypothetical protein